MAVDLDGAGLEGDDLAAGDGAADFLVAMS